MEWKDPRGAAPWMEDQAPPWLAKASRDQLKVELADGSSVPINDAQWQEIENFQQGKPLEPNYMFCIGHRVKWSFS